MRSGPNLRIRLIDAIMFEVRGETLQEFQLENFFGAMGNLYVAAVCEILKENVTMTLKRVL